nr:MgtC/SapB family protein [uncultured Acidocella sp.]
MLHGFNPNWLQIGELSLAFLFSALIGTEREIRQKSAGLRTHALVGVAAALFMIVSKHGFDNVLAPYKVVLDPSRVAAQVVSGIGFIGGGVIFTQRNAVRGLTTAASIWFTAALGMACGAGLVALSLATLAGYFIVMLGLPRLARQLPRHARQQSEIKLRYQDGRGLLRTVLVTCTQLRFSVDRVALDREEERAPGEVTLALLVRGKRPLSHLLVALGDIEGVREVARLEEDAGFE